MLDFGITSRWSAVWRAAVATAMLDPVMTATTPAQITCLIVDDSFEFIEAARQLLTEDGVITIGFAATSDEAVDAASALQPDVVLVDIGLGTESGVDVALRLVELPNGGPPVVLISAESSSELSELVGTSGARGFVSKTDLSGDTIRRLLGPADAGG
jgi:DNA-binding NarL/FixJ family response regulator